MVHRYKGNNYVTILYRVAPQPMLICLLQWYFHSVVLCTISCLVIDSGVFCLCHHKFRYFPMEGCSTSVLFPAFLRVWHITGAQACKFLQRTCGPAWKNNYVDVQQTVIYFLFGLDTSLLWWKSKAGDLDFPVISLTCCESCLSKKKKKCLGL